MSKLEVLWTYQQAELEFEQAEAKLKSTPARVRLGKLHSFLSEQQAQITNLQKQMETRQATLNRLSSQLDEAQHRYELELSEFSAMQNDEECTAAELTESRRSLEALSSQLAAVAREVASVRSFVEKALGEYKNTYAKAGKAKKEYDAVRAECESEMAAGKPELNALSARLEERRKEVDPALLKRYQAVKGHHATPMARVLNNQCSGCRMSLPTSIVKKVATGEGVVECENCGRILYTAQ